MTTPIVPSAAAGAAVGAAAEAATPPPATGPFAHLHCHTHYSLLDGASKIPNLMKHVKSLGMTSVAMTDHGNLYGAIEFYTEAKKAGLNPVVGYEAYIAPGGHTKKLDKRRGEAAHLTLLAKNTAGFKNLVRLSSIAYLKGYHYVPRIDMELLKAHSEGLICLSGCVSSEFSRFVLANKIDEAKDLARSFQAIFGENFYIEVQNNSLDIQRDHRIAAIPVAQTLGIPLVATSDAHYLERGDALAHDALLCINTGAKMSDVKRMRYGNGDGRVVDKFYVCSPAEMYERFPEHADAVRRSQEIADSVDIQLDFKTKHFPVFRPPAERSPSAYLRELCEQGAVERYGDRPPAGWKERLSHELGIIDQMGFAAYFLIVWDFVRFARERNIPAGARGSGVGALVSYLLYLSHVCPLEHDLLFERFLDPSRTEPPDIDIDICQDGREEVIQYVRDKYGAESVAQIGTFSTLSARSVLRDVGRVLDAPLGEVDKLAKRVPERPGVTLDEANAESADFRAALNSRAQFGQLYEIAKRLEGTNRGSGTHAAGVVIAPGPLTEYVPLQLVVAKNGEEREGPRSVTTQWDMGAVEKVGLLKMDFLGLRTLTVVKTAIRLISETRGERVDIDRLPPGDAETFALLQRGDTKGVFQFESDGIRELLRRMRPDRIDDLIAANALYRPGPLDGGLVDAYIERKHGREKIPAIHPAYDGLLATTYSVIVYQEQIMQILNRLGDIPLGAAYTCIKAISKKKQDIIDARREEFVAGAVSRGMARNKAVDIFDQIAKFGSYGFNKSHSTAYADLAYKTAFLKCHYKPEFMAALLTSETSDRDSLVLHIDDARAAGVEVRPPDVNLSGAGFAVDPCGRVVFGLAGIKGLGTAAVAEILRVRQEDGPFRGIVDFSARVDFGECGEAATEKLIGAGAFDSIIPTDRDGNTGNRAQIAAVLPNLVKRGKRFMAKQRRFAGDLFDDVKDLPPEPDLPPCKDWPEPERLRREKAALDLYLSTHPLARHEAEVDVYATFNVPGAVAAPGRRGAVAGAVCGLKEQTSTKARPGQPSKFARFRLEDLHGSMECIIWPEAFAREAAKLAEDAVVYLIGTAEEREPPSFVVDRVVPVESGPRTLARGLAVRLHLKSTTPNTVDSLGALLRRHREGGRRIPVHLVVDDGNGHTAEVRCGEEWSVCPDDLPLSEVEAVVGKDNVRFMGVRRPTPTPSPAPARPPAAEMAAA